MPAAHEPTDEQREMVEAMAAFGIPEADIARVIGLDGVDPKTLRKHYRDELDLGLLKANSKVAGELFKAATMPTMCREKMSAIFFWLKTRAGWKETQVIETPDLKNRRVMTDAELEAIASGGSSEAAEAANGA